MWYNVGIFKVDGGNMALNIIYGPAGSGKSRFVYDRIIEEAVEHMDKKFIVLVPEQYTMSTQRLLVELHPDHCIMNIDVLSFNRLAYRVFEELGQNVNAVLEDIGKVLVLRKLASEHENEMVALKRNIKRAGYITQIKSLISEMTQYRITPEVLKEMMSYEAMSSTFSKKAADLLVIYQAFLDFIEGRYVTTESLLDKLSGMVADSDMVSDAVVVMDEFTGFTPVQYHLVEEMMKCCSDLYVTMNMDPRESFTGEISEDELFAMTKEFTRQLTFHAKKVGCEINEPVFLDGSKGRLKDSEVLAFLEENIFRADSFVYEGEANPAETISLFSMRNRREELLSCAIEIDKLIKTGEYHYSDIAVVCPDLAQYRFLIPEVWQDFGISYFIDSKSEIVFHPFVEMVDAVFEMYDSGFTKESVFRFLRAGFTELTVEETDLLENYFTAAGIRGKRRFFSEFTATCNTFDKPEQLEQLNDIRKKYIKPFEVFEEAVGKKTHTVSEIARALYDLIVSFDCDNKLMTMAKDKENSGDVIKAREYDQIYRIVMNILDKMVAILKDEVVSLDEFHEIYLAGMADSTIGVIPPARDSVVVGDMERSRLNNVKVLFIIGAADDAIPKKQENGGILSQLERELLLKKFEMAPSDRVKSFRQRYYIYMMLTAPSKKLIISYPRTGSDGKGVNKSYLIDTIQHMFNLKLVHVEERGLEDRLHTRTEAYRLMLQLMARIRDEGTDSLSEDERNWLEKLIAYFGKDKDNYNSLLEHVFYTYKPNPFSEEIMEAINECFNEDETVRGSVTKFETYAKCGFRYFMDYVLRTRDRELYELSYMDIGNCYHSAIEKYCSLITENNEDWHKLDKETISDYSKQAIDFAVESMPKTAANLDAIQTHILEGMKETLAFCMENLTYQVQEGLFDPAYFEEPVTNELINPVSGERTAIVHGKIDRIDLHHTDKSLGVRIVDYKSSARAFSPSDCFYGLSMQLPMYMSFAVEKLKDRYPDLEVNPSAFLYYHVDDPMVAGNSTMDIDNLRKKERNLKGLIVGDELNLQANDTKLEAGVASDVVKVKLTKSGEPDTYSDVVSADDMKTLLEYAKVNGALLSEDILEGKFEPVPTSVDGKSCQYCAYNSVCRFDPTTPGTKAKVCGTLKKDEAVGLMRERLEAIRNGEINPVLTETEITEVLTDEMD